MKIKVLILSLLLLLTGCNEKNPAPRHKVLGTDSMKVYSAFEVNNPVYGKYEYWVTDGTGLSWVLITDSEFQVGDRLEITKK